MPDVELLRTPLYHCHLERGARLVPFAGYEMPVQYSGVLDETKTVRSSAGLFDVSHMGQFSVKGNSSLEEVQRLVTNDLSKLAIGQAQYNMLCNPEGGVIDDLVIYRRSVDETFICVNASNRAKDFEWMQRHLKRSVTLEDQSDHTALIALQGPKSESILANGADPSILNSLKYYWATETPVFGKACYLSRTGYTGEDGFELYVARDHALAIWEALLDTGKRYGLVPAGLGARDTLRLEMGYPLHGHELSPEISPLQAGLSWVVKLNLATPFIGQESLRKEAAAGPFRKLRALRINDRRIARQGYAIANSEQKPIGQISSGSFSPHLNCPIALGFVSKENINLESVSVQIRDAFVSATTTKLPFVPAHTKK